MKAHRSDWAATGSRWRYGAGSRPIVIGHRGAAGLAPENTLVAFERGLSAGADAVECDVHLTRDGRLAVIHDEALSRTTNGHGLVGDLTLAELQALDAGSWRGGEFAAERIPSLEDLLGLVRGRTGLLVEIKQGPVFYRGIEETLVDALCRFEMLADTLVISFDHHSIRRVRQLCPEVACAVLYSARPVDPAALARAADAQALMPDWALVTPEEVAAAQAAGLLILPWTVNDPLQMARLLDLGVDGIGSDYPDQLRAIVDSRP